MLELTTAAEECLLELRAERGSIERSGVRFIAPSGELQIVFVAAPGPDDCVVTGADLPIFVAPEASALLDRGVLDVASRDQRSVLVLRRRAPTSEGVMVRLERSPFEASHLAEDPGLTPSRH